MANVSLCLTKTSIRDQCSNRWVATFAIVTAGIHNIVENHRLYTLDLNGFRAGAELKLPFGCLH